MTQFLSFLWLSNIPLYVYIYICIYMYVYVYIHVYVYVSVQFSSVAQSCLTLRPHESQHARPPCPSRTPRFYSNSCPSSQWCHPAISSSVVPFSSCPQSFPASESFPISKLFTWGGQSIGVSALASALPINTQDWSPLGWTGWTSLQSKGAESRDPYLLHSQQGQYVGKCDCWNHAFVMLHVKKALMMEEVFG